MRLACLLVVTLACFGQDKPEPKYAMDNYVVGILKRGPNWTPRVTEETKKIQEGHMANIRRMADLGKLAVAGPFVEGGDLRGMFIFKATTIEEAKAMAAEDPAIKSGRLAIDFYRWFAAKGLSVPPPVSR